MVISYRDRAIFVHIPKNAGTSLRSTLVNRATVTVDRQGDTREGEMYMTGPDIWKHLKYWELKESLSGDDFGQSICSDFFKFAFVRNPWDRHVSFYHFLMQKTGNPEDGPVASPAGHKRAMNCGSFEGWVKDSLDRVQRNEYVNYLHPQWSWTHIDGKQAVDFIGRYENLHDDFEIVRGHLGLPEDCSLSHENKSSHRDYKSYYTDETRQMIGEIFAEDITLFGYTFEGRE